MWIDLLKQFSVYGPLGVMFIISLMSASRKQKSDEKSQKIKDNDYQSSYKQLLDTVLDQNNKSMDKLEDTMSKLMIMIEKQGRYYDNTIGDIATEIARLRDGCLSTCGQVLTSIYDNKLLPKNVFENRLSDITTIKTYQAVIDLSTTIDQNGFDSEENIEVLKQSIRRIIEKRGSEITNEIEKLEYDKDTRADVLMVVSLEYGMMIQDIEEKVFPIITTHSLSTDKNYKRLKTLVKNIIFKGLDGMALGHHNILR